MEEINYCPMCGGDLIPIGKMGRIMHSRCRGCGMQTMRDTTEHETNFRGQWRDENDLGGTGHGDDSYSDADPGL